MSDSSSDEEQELLINTRQRRANAGSRLKHLLELEERQQEELTQSYGTEEDENVNLLFQEDEQDEEYSEEESSEAEEDGEEGEEGEEGAERAGTEDGDNSEVEENTDSAKTRKRKRNESDSEAPEADEDDVFTDSDDDSHESDEEEGEKELQKAERQARRSNAKKAKANIIPKIKAPPTAAKSKRSKDHEVEATSLLDVNRRSSSRKAAVENKLATVQKLKEAEERRKLNKPKDKVEQYVMTQEERLAEALETEKQNISSLNRFKEQEIYKKEKQRAAQLAKRKKLTEFVRFVSYQDYISPLEEIEAEQKYQEWMESRQEKRGKGRRKPVEKKATTTTKSPSQLLTPEPESAPEDAKDSVEAFSEQPKAEDGAVIDEGAVASEATESDRAIVKSEEDIVVSHEEKSKMEKDEYIDVKSENEDELQVEENKEGSDVADTTELKEDLPLTVEDTILDQKTVEVEEEASLSDSPAVETTITETTEVVKKVTFAPDESLKEETDLNEAEPADESERITDGATDESVVDEAAKMKNSPSDLEEGTPKPEIKTEETLDGEEEGQVEETAESDELEEQGPQYEGPCQLVGRNVISFEDFEDEVSTNHMKELLLGKQSLDVAQRRSVDVEHLLKIRAGTGDDNLEKNLFKSYKELQKQQFKAFYNMPRFGDDLSKMDVDQEEEEEEVAQEVKITTEAPVGIYLSNGVKKKCLISGKESQYFDPKSGLPYGSVEAYRVLQQVQNGEFLWCQFHPKAGVYLTERTQRAATGVPDRF